MLRFFVSVCLIVCLPACLCLVVTGFLYFCLYLFVTLCIRVSAVYALLPASVCVCLMLICLSVSLYVCTFVCMCASVCLFRPVCLSLPLSVCVFVCLPASSSFSSFIYVTFKAQRSSICKHCGRLVDDGILCSPSHRLSIISPYSISWSSLQAAGARRIEATIATDGFQSIPFTQSNVLCTRRRVPRTQLL